MLDVSSFFSLPAPIAIAHSVRHRRSTATTHVTSQQSRCSLIDFISESRTLRFPFDFDLCVSYVVSQREIVSQFWLGGRRYWGRGIGARPHLLLGDAASVSFSHQRDLIKQQSYLVLGVNSERYSRED